MPRFAITAMKARTAAAPIASTRLSPSSSSNPWRSRPSYRRQVPGRNLVRYSGLNVSSTKLASVGACAASASVPCVCATAISRFASASAPARVWMRA